MTMRITKVDAELYSTSEHVVLKPVRVTKVDSELYSTSAHIILKPIRVSKVDAELYSTTPFPTIIPLRVTKVDAELYSTSPHVILKPVRVTKVDAELYSTISYDPPAPSGTQHLLYISGSVSRQGSALVSTSPLNSIKIQKTAKLHQIPEDRFNDTTYYFS